MSSEFTEEQQRRITQAPLSGDYIPTEEEKKVLEECSHESFLYRSLPFSFVSIAITQGLVTRGILSSSLRFGSLPKVAFAGFFGYMAGKVSYMKTCREKLKKLENSPLGEILRQREGMPPRFPGGPQSERRDPNSPSFDSMFQPPDGVASSQSRDHGYGFRSDPSGQMERADDFSTPVQSYLEEDTEPQKKSILYEDLRLKNRENYEVTLTQKADTMLKAPTEKDPERSKNPVKKNIYGDAWEE